MFNGNLHGEFAIISSLYTGCQEFETVHIIEALNEEQDN